MMNTPIRIRLVSSTIPSLLAGGFAIALLAIFTMVTPAYAETYTASPISNAGQYSIEALTDAYETLRIDLKDVPKNPYFTISTSEKRCFIDEIRVLVPKNDAEAIELLPQDSSSYVSDYVDLSGRRYKNLPKKKGVYIHHRKKIVRY